MTEQTPNPISGPTPVKPGLKSTEFYRTLLVDLAGLAVAFGFINPLALGGIEHAIPPALAAISQVIISLGGLAGAVTSALGYNKKRAEAKINQAKMDAVVAKNNGSKQ